MTNQPPELPTRVWIIELANSDTDRVTGSGYRIDPGGVVTVLDKNGAPNVSYAHGRWTAIEWAEDS